jgi:hypothetical protein
VIARRLVLALSLSMVLVTAAIAQQKRWFELYDEAIQHVRRSEWSLAEAKLQQAKKDGPSPGRAVLRYGSWRDDFFPDFYLGVVYVNIGRGKEALQQFQLARTQKLNVQDREFQQISQLETNARLLEAVPGVTANNTEKPKPPAPVPVETAKPEIAKPVETPAAPAPTPAAPAAPDLSAERKRLESQFEQAIQGRNIGAARTLLVDLQKVQPDQKAIAGYTARVNTLDRDIRLATSERSAMRAFFAGNYQQAVASLNAIEQELGAPLSPRGYFYRACGLAAQALRAPQVDNKALTEARRHYAEAMKNRQVIAPDRRYVSPRILQALGS